MNLLAAAGICWLLTIPLFRLVNAVPDGRVPGAIRSSLLLMAFNPIILSGLVPIPLMRLVYIALGARIGSGSYGGRLLDPHLTFIGQDSILSNAIVACHAIEHGRKIIDPVYIGNRVTIGVNATILPGAIIGDDAIVAAGAVVTKGTYIGRGETWGGVPARKLK